MDKNRPLCTVVIRCYNEEQHISKLLAGIMAQTVKDIEIILVDSGSTDATLSIASAYPVKVLSIKPEEFSFGRALNLGCLEASGEFITIASAHVYPIYNDWIETLIKHFDDAEVALVYGKQRGPENSRYTEQQIYKKWFPDDSVNRQEHPFCNNANTAIRRSLWKKLPYNEELTGLEDLDWAKRITEMGNKTVYDADAEIIHIHNETAFKVYNRYRREAIAFKRIYSHENFTLSDFLKLVTVNVVTDYYHAFKDGKLLRNLFSIPTFRLMQFWGTYRGFQKSGLVSQQLRTRFYYPNGFFRDKTVSSEKDIKRRIDYEGH